MRSKKRTPKSPYSNGKLRKQVTQVQYKNEKKRKKKRRERELVSSQEHEAAEV